LEGPTLALPRLRQLQNRACPSSAAPGRARLGLFVARPSATSPRATADGRARSTDRTSRRGREVQGRRPGRRRRVGRGRPQPTGARIARTLAATASITSPSSDERCGTFARRASPRRDCSAALRRSRLWTSICLRRKSRCSRVTCSCSSCHSPSAASGCRSYSTSRGWRERQAVPPPSAVRACPVLASPDRTRLGLTRRRLLVTLR
jgi:hypothetical protein